MTVKKSTNELVYNGPGEVVNLDVALETGDGRLEPGRKIAVSAELAETLQRSTPYWDTGAAPTKTASKKKSAAKPRVAKAAAPSEPPAANPAIDAAESGSLKEDES